MARLSAKYVFQLWERLAEMEHTTGHELALRVGIGPSTVTSWRKGRTTTVHPSIFGLIEARLGYRCTLKPDGTWDVQRINQQPEPMPASVPQPSPPKMEPEEYAPLPEALKMLPPKKLAYVLTLAVEMSRLNPEDLDMMAMVIDRLRLLEYEHPGKQWKRDPLEHVR